jgi:two-component system cell cycle sensor histidine kinase/response regulator CckA
MNTFYASHPKAAGSRPLAFVVDDDRQVRTFIQAVLEARHYAVMSFANPSEALDALTGLEGEISVLISDVHMPEINGVTFAREAMRRFSGLPVLLISGSPQIQNRDPPLPLLPKPFSPGMLVAAVERVIAAPRAMPTPVQH